MADEPLNGTTLQTAYERIRALQQREWSAAESINAYYRNLTQSYARELEDAFYRYFTYPADQKPHWDARAAQAAAVPASLADQFEEVLANLDDFSDQQSDNELEEAFLEGWYFGLREVYMTGVDVDHIEPPSREVMHAAIAGIAIGGLSLSDRSRRWLADARLKFITGIRATILGESTLPDTLQWFNGIGDFLEQRVSASFESEVHRAFELGQRMAIAQFPELLIGEVWVTRQDLRVCPFCAALHLTVTPLKPIEDSHPGCRCVKIPILHGAARRAVDMSYFLSEIV